MPNNYLKRIKSITVFINLGLNAVSFLDQMHKFFSLSTRVNHRFFLLHHQLFWITNPIKIVKYGLGFFLLSCLIPLFVPFQLDKWIPHPSIFSLFSMLFFLPFSVKWIIRQMSFSIERNFGYQTLISEYQRLFIYILFFFFIIFSPFISYSIASFKIASLVSKQALQKDYNLLSGHLYNIGNIKNKEFIREVAVYPLVEYENKEKNTVNALDILHKYGASYDAEHNSIYMLQFTSEEINLLIHETLKKMNYISTQHRYIDSLIDPNITYIVLLLLSCKLVFFSVFLQTCKVLGLQNSLLAISITIFGLLASYVLGDFMNTKTSGLISRTWITSAVWFAFILPFFFQSIFVNYIEFYSKFKAISVAMVYLSSPFLLLYAFFFLQKDVPVLGNSNVIGLLFLGYLTTCAIFLPIFRYLTLRLIALPKPE